MLHLRRAHRYRFRSEIVVQPAELRCTGNAWKEEDRTVPSANTKSLNEGIDFSIESKIESDWFGIRFRMKSYGLAFWFSELRHWLNIQLLHDSNGIRMCDANDMKSDIYTNAIPQPVQLCTENIGNARRIFPSWNTFYPKIGKQNTSNKFRLEWVSSILLSIRLLNVAFVCSGRDSLRTFGYFSLA